MPSEALTPETVRALLDAAGLPGAEVTAGTDADWPWADADGFRAVFIGGGDLCPIYDTSNGAGYRNGGDYYHAVDLPSELARKVTARHDAAARVLGAPDLATARGLAAENAALKAEVERLRDERNKAVESERRAMVGMVSDGAVPAGWAVRALNAEKWFDAAASRGDALAAEAERLRAVAEAARACHLKYGTGLGAWGDLRAALAALEAP